MNNKIIRYLSGFLLLILIIASFYISKILLFFVSALFIIAAMYEYRAMFKTKNIYPHKILPELAGIIFAGIFIFEYDLIKHNLITPIFMTVFIFSFIFTVIKNKKPYILNSLSTIAACIFIFCGLYIIKLTYYFEHLHSFYLILFYFTAVLTGDFAASRIGPKFKKPLLAPEISPNKTVAGAVTNLICACISCLPLKIFVNFSILQCLTLGIVISVFSQFGDLTVSTFKRDLCIKHSGSLFYNYGGILDRMDAFLFSAPAAYYCIFLIQVNNAIY